MSQYGRGFSLLKMLMFFFLGLCILDSELRVQCLVLYCVLLIPHYSVWFCTVYSWVRTTVSGSVLYPIDSELQFLVLYCVLLIFNYSFLVLNCEFWVFNYSPIVLICGLQPQGLTYLLES